MRGDGGPAFPREDYQANGGGGHNLGQEGMSLRDYFAGQALAGLMASQTAEGEWRSDARQAAERAYEAADAMLNERQK